MRDHDERQVGGGQTLGQGQVGGDLETVGRLVADGFHRRELRPRQLLADAVLERELLAGPVEKVGLAGLGVARGGDQGEALVLGQRAKIDLFARQLPLQQLVVGLEALALPVDADLVVDVGGRDEVVGALGEDRAAEVHPVQRIGFDQLFAARLGVEQHEAGQVRVALVGRHVDAPAVLVETHREAGLENVARVDFLEAVAVDAEDFRVAVLGRAGGQPELVLAIEHPAGQPLGVLAQERPLAGRELHLVEVVPGGIAVVEPDVDRVRVGLGHRVDEGPGAFRRGHVARRRHPLSGGGGSGRIDGVDVEVLVAALVLHVEDELAVLAPEVAGDRALGLGGDGPGRLEGLVDALDPDVARAVEGLDEGDVPAVGRELPADDLGIAEEELPVDERRRRWRLGPGGRREGQQDGTDEWRDLAGRGSAGAALQGERLVHGERTSLGQ